MLLHSVFLHSIPYNLCCLTEKTYQLNLHDIYQLIIYISEFLDPTSLTGKLYARISMLENELTLLTQQRAAQEAEIANIENLALKQRFLSKLADIETHIREKEDEVNLAWYHQLLNCTS